MYRQAAMFLLLIPLSIEAQEPVGMNIVTFRSDLANVLRVDELKGKSTTLYFHVVYIEKVKDGYLLTASSPAGSALTWRSSGHFVIDAKEAAAFKDIRQWQAITVKAVYRENVKAANYLNGWVPKLDKTERLPHTAKLADRRTPSALQNGTIGKFRNEVANGIRGEALEGQVFEFGARVHSIERKDGGFQLAIQDGSNSRAIGALFDIKPEAVKEFSSFRESSAIRVKGRYKGNIRHDGVFEGWTPLFDQAELGD